MNVSEQSGQVEQSSERASKLSDIEQMGGNVSEQGEQIEQSSERASLFNSVAQVIDVRAGLSVAPGSLRCDH